MSNLTFNIGDAIAFDGSNDSSYGILRSVLYKTHELVIDVNQFLTVVVPMSAIREVNGSIIKVF